LRSELFSNGIVLLHAPSGAGKTSLIQASLVPWCEQAKGLQACGTLKPHFSALRVNLPPPEGLDIQNRYVFSVVNALVGNIVDRHEAAEMTLDEAFNRFAGESGRRQLVVVDQLEEVLTLNPNDRPGQAEFFRQLGIALRSDRRWALLAIRDDHLGGLDCYRPFFPNELRATFRLDFPDLDAALRAIQGPAAERQVTFTLKAAQRLVDDLQGLRAAPVAVVDAAIEPVVDRVADYSCVEPVLLQVICNNLWRILSKRQLGAFVEIAERDLEEVRPYHQALASYYQAAVRKATNGDSRVERDVRDWIEGRLISRQLSRCPTNSLPLFEGSAEVVQKLIDRYLVREDPRPGGRLWELSHDQLVPAILADNRRWREANLQNWQVRADHWNRSGRPARLLLTGPDLRSARASAAKLQLAKIELAFLEESRGRDDEETHTSRLEAATLAFRSRASSYRLALVCSLTLNVIFLVVFVLGV
jgi:hypothetical protein